MSLPKENLSIRLRRLVNNGCTPEDAALALGISPEIARQVIESVDSVELTPDELLIRAKPRLIKALVDIALDETLENPNVRVNAAKVLLDQSSFDELKKSDTIKRVFEEYRQALNSHESELKLVNGNESLVADNKELDLVAI
jgi:hypothetical protein